MQRFRVWWVLIFMAQGLCGLASADESGQHVLSRAEQFARGYDLNRQEKYLIDFHYSPMHAMAVYRELLLWLDQPEVPAALREDLLATVTAGMVSIIRDSHAGPDTETLPLGIGFLRAMPRYRQEPDFSRQETLLWRSDGMEQKTSPAAVGKSMSAKALLLMRLPPVAPERKLVLASLRREFDDLSAQLMKLMPQGYMPEVALWDGAWKVEDGRSRLFSQAALLRGLIETEAALATLGAGEQPWRDRVQHSIEAVFSGLVQRHHDAESGSFVDVYDPEKGRGDRVMLEDMAQLIDGLTVLLQYQSTKTPLWVRAQQLGKKQIEFLMRVGKWDEPPPRGYLVRKATPLRATVRSLEDPLAALSVLQQAERFGAVGTGEAQKNLAALLARDYWAEKPGIYRSAVGFTVSAYDGHLFALNLRWLRRSGGAEAMRRGDDLIRVVLKDAGLLQCEPVQSGEPLSLEQGLVQRGERLVNEIAALPTLEQGERIAAFVRELADQDADNVPGCRFAAGRFGGPPVPIIQTSIKTPFASATDDPKGL